MRPLCPRRSGFVAEAVVAVSVVVLAVSGTAAAAEPTFGLAPLTSTSIVVPSDATATVQYLVTNNTIVTRTLTMLPIAGIAQSTAGVGTCSLPFVLGPQQSCKLVLVVDGAQLPKNGVHGGPVICKTKGPADSSPDPFLCSQPSTANEFAVTVGPCSGCVDPDSGVQDGGTEDASVADASVEEDASAVADASTDDAGAEPTTPNDAGGGSGAPALDASNVDASSPSAAPIAPSETVAAPESSSCAATPGTRASTTLIGALGFLVALAVGRRRSR